MASRFVDNFDGKALEGFSRQIDDIGVESQPVQSLGTVDNETALSTLCFLLVPIFTVSTILVRLCHPHGKNTPSPDYQLSDLHNAVDSRQRLRMLGAVVAQVVSDAVTMNGCDDQLKRISEQHQLLQRQFDDELGAKSARLIDDFNTGSVWPFDKLEDIKLQLGVIGAKQAYANEERSLFNCRLAVMELNNLLARHGLVEGGETTVNHVNKHVRVALIRALALVDEFRLISNLSVDEAVRVVIAAAEEWIQQDIEAEINDLKTGFMLKIEAGQEDVRKLYLTKASRMNQYLLSHAGEQISETGSGNCSVVAHGYQQGVTHAAMSEHSSLALALMNDEKEMMTSLISIKNQCTLAMEAEIRVLRHWHEEVCVAAAAEARKLRQDVDQRRSALKADFDFQCLRLQESRQHDRRLRNTRIEFARVCESYLLATLQRDAMFCCCSGLMALLAGYHYAYSVVHDKELSIIILDYLRFACEELKNCKSDFVELVAPSFAGHSIPQPISRLFSMTTLLTLLVPKNFASSLLGWQFVCIIRVLVPIGVPVGVAHLLHLVGLGQIAGFPLARYLVCAGMLYSFWTVLQPLTLAASHHPLVGYVNIYFGASAMWLSALCVRPRFFWPLSLGGHVCNMRQVLLYLLFPLFCWCVGLAVFCLHMSIVPQDFDLSHSSYSYVPPLVSKVFHVLQLVMGNLFATLRS